MTTGTGNPNEPNAEHNTTEGQGQAVDTPAPPAAQVPAANAGAAAPAASGAAPAPTASGAGPAAAPAVAPANGGGAAAADICPDILLPDDPEVAEDEKPPNNNISDLAVAAARADALKPVGAATEDLYSDDPVKKAAREAVQTAYAKAAAPAQDGKPEGDLRAKYAAVDVKFRRAATDMKDRLPAWVAKRMAADDNSFTPLLADMAQFQKRLDQRAGPREHKRDLAAAKAKAWQQAYANWSKPAETMAALIADYADKIDPMNARSNVGPDTDYAIYSFWFEVAPKHLQLRSDPVSEANAPGVTTILNALIKYPDLVAALKSGRERGDGSVYLIDPSHLAEHRTKVLGCWRTAAEEQGKRDAAFKLRPDDAASLKTRRDQLTQGLAASVKTRLQDPPA